MSLFRKEAIEHKNDDAHGDIIIPASFGMTFSSIATIALLILIALFLYIGEYTRKAHLSGIVMPSGDIISV